MPASGLSEPSGRWRVARKAAASVDDGLVSFRVGPDAVGIGGRRAGCRRQGEQAGGNNEHQVSGGFGLAWHGFFSLECGDWYAAWVAAFACEHVGKRGGGNRPLKRR